MALAGSLARFGIAIKEVLENLQPPFFLGTLTQAPRAAPPRALGEEFGQPSQDPEPQEHKEDDCQTQGEEGQHFNWSEKTIISQAWGVSPKRKFGFHSAGREC